MRRSKIVVVAANAARFGIPIVAWAVQGLLPASMRLSPYREEDLALAGARAFGNGTRKGGSRTSSAGLQDASEQ